MSRYFIIYLFVYYTHRCALAERNKTYNSNKTQCGVLAAKISIKRKTRQQIKLITINMERGREWMKGRQLFRCMYD